VINRLALVYINMNEKRQEQPFRQLGERLKTIRQKLHESVAEVSGAVEIDEPTLQRIEQGNERPSEDILMLLISHFGMRDDEAAGLWQLAGYDQPRNHDHDTNTSDDSNQGRATILVMAVDPRVIYSDGVQVTANRNGVVISFSQANGSNTLTTARIGMSREQAGAVIHTLQEALGRSEPRQLPGAIDGKKDDHAR
jgi:transcriptional regulator with XRE-family HTH domain